MKSFTACFVAIIIAGTFTTLSASAHTPIDPTIYSEPVKIACVGDSITKGLGLEKGKSYPDLLQGLLGQKWVVKNFGLNSRTLLKKGNHPYWIEKAFTDAQNFQPDVVIIMLGTNDTKPQNWVHSDEFAADYKALVETFKNLSSKPRVFICRPPPVTGNGNGGINEQNIQLELPMIDQVATEESVDIIDQHAPLVDKPELFPDCIHPNAAGAAILAQTVATALTDKAVTP